jgi:hypothetical protein
MIGVGRGRDSRKRRTAVLGISLLAVLLLLILGACGGKSSQSGGTQAGTYPISITASTTQGTSLSHTVTATMTVK